MCALRLLLEAGDSWHQHLERAPYLNFAVPETGRQVPTTTAKKINAAQNTWRRLAERDMVGANAAAEPARASTAQVLAIADMPSKQEVFVRNDRF